MPLSEEAIQQIPEDIRGEASLSKFNDFGGMAKSYINLEKKIGSSIPLPGKDFTPEELKAWQNDSALRLRDTGLTFAKIQDLPPEKPDAYEFNVEGIEPEKINNDKAIAGFKNVAHKLGLNQAQAGEMVNWYLKDVIPMLKADGEAAMPKMIEDQAGIEQVLNDRFRGETKQRLADSEKATRDLSASIPDLKDLLEGTAPNGDSWMPIKYHPAWVALSSEVARMRQQDFGGHVTDPFRGETVEGIDMQIKDLRGRTDIDGEDMGQRLNELYRKKVAIANANKGR